MGNAGRPIASYVFRTLPCSASRRQSCAEAFGSYAGELHREGFVWAWIGWGWSVGWSRAEGRCVVPESHNDGAVASPCRECRVGVDFDAAITEFMQHGESVEGGLGNAVFGDETEAAVEGGFDDALFFEDVGEGPVAHGFGETVALADGVGKPWAHVDRVGNVGLVGVAGVVLAEDQRQFRKRRSGDLVVYLADGAAYHAGRAGSLRLCGRHLWRCRSRRRGC